LFDSNEPLCGAFPGPKLLKLPVSCVLLGEELLWESVSDMSWKEALFIFENNKPKER